MKQVRNIGMGGMTSLTIEEVNQYIINQKRKKWIKDKKVSIFSLDKSLGGRPGFYLKDEDLYVSRTLIKPWVDPHINSNGIIIKDL